VGGNQTTQGMCSIDNIYLYKNNPGKLDLNNDKFLIFVGFILPGNKNWTR